MKQMRNDLNLNQQASALLQKAAARPAGISPQVSGMEKKQDFTRCLPGP